MFFFTATRLLPPIADELSIKENIGRSICTVNDGNQLITMEGAYRKRAPFQNVQTFSISAESRRWKEMKVLRFQWVITQSPHRCAAVASKGAASQLKRRRDQRKERWFSRGNQVFWQSWWNQRSPLMTPVFNIQRCHTQDKATSTYWLSSHANLVVGPFFANERRQPEWACHLDSKIRNHYGGVHMKCFWRPVRRVLTTNDNILAACYLAHKASKFVKCVRYAHETHPFWHCFTALLNGVGHNFAQVDVDVFQLLKKRKVFGSNQSAFSRDAISSSYLVSVEL